MAARITVQVVMSDHSEVEVDFAGSAPQAGIMVIRHYHDAVAAWLCADGKRAQTLFDVRAEVMHETCSHGGLVEASRLHKRAVAPRRAGQSKEST
jgi:hypothetical protein